MTKFDKRSAYGKRMQAIADNPPTLADKIADLHKEINVEAKKAEMANNNIQYLLTKISKLSEKTELLSVDQIAEALKETV
tara:strand:+ start:495 stop:734 length:240 start_codon:yes stop_codon:yes gene_type:complete